MLFAMKLYEIYEIQKYKKTLIEGKDEINRNLILKRNYFFFKLSKIE